METNKNYKQELAMNWIHGYAATGAGIVIAAIIPGSTSAALMALEGIMAYHIGKIYRDLITMDDALQVAQKVGLAAVLGKVAAIEALNLVPVAGWALKAPIAAAVIELLGHQIILHFESGADGLPA